MNLLILHLSDIHVRSENDDILKRSELIARATYKDLSLADAVVILVTGDLAYSGKSEEYTLVERFIANIKENIQAERPVLVSIIVCPGNHDCDFDSGKPDVREIVIDSIKKTSPDDIKDAIIEECAEVQNNFFDFRKRLSTAEVCFENKLWMAQRVTIGTQSIIFHCVNVAWMSKRKEQAGLIAFPIKRFQEPMSLAADVSITCMHHPLNWFGQASYRSFRQFIRKHSHLVLTGHEHVQSAAYIDDTDSGESIAIDGGVLYEVGEVKSQFNIISLDLDKQEYSCSFDLLPSSATNLK